MILGQVADGRDMMTSLHDPEAFIPAGGVKAFAIMMGAGSVSDCEGRGLGAEVR
jgi:hypothetical protein